MAESSEDQNQKSTTIEHLTASDELGRCRFFLNWTESGGKNRGQVFFANPELYGFKKPEANKD